MAAKMKEYRYYLSSGVNAGVRVKISLLELAPAVPLSVEPHGPGRGGGRPAIESFLQPDDASSSSAAVPSSSSSSSSSSAAAAVPFPTPLRAFPAPELTQRIGLSSSTELRNAAINEIVLTAQIYADGRPLHAMVLSAKAPTKCSESTIYWNEWLAFPVRYRDLPRHAQLALTVWGVGWVPLGGTTLPLFTRQGVLRDGLQCLRLWPHVAADPAPEATTTPAIPDRDRDRERVDPVGGEGYRLDKLRERYERKEMARNEWMDGVTDRRIARIRRGGEPPGRRDPLGPFCSYRQDAALWIELPYFGDVVVYEEEPYGYSSGGGGGGGGAALATFPPHHRHYHGAVAAAAAAATTASAATGNVYSPQVESFGGNKFLRTGGNGSTGISLGAMAVTGAPIVPAPVGVGSASGGGGTGSSAGGGPVVAVGIGGGAAIPSVAVGAPTSGGMLGDGGAYGGPDGGSGGGGGGLGGGGGRELAGGGSLIVVWDPDLNEENPAERKYRKLARDILRGSIDPNLKPSRDEKARIEMLLATPTDALKNEDKDLLWKFRYTLTDNRKAVVKFLLSVDWNDETEVKQATDLLEQWCEIDIADALKLLGRDKEFKHEGVRNFAVATLARARNDDLLDFLLQLVQALRYEKVGSTAAVSAAETSSTDGPVNESLGPLARFLIARSSEDFHMANYFYWYLKVEAADFSRDAEIFRIVLSQMLEEMKRDAEKRPIYDMLMMQQDFMEKLLAFHNKAREEKGRKDQKEEKFRQLLKHFPWQKGAVIRLPLDPTIHLSGLVASSAKMFKSAMYPAVVQFQTVLPQDQGSSAHSAHQPLLRGSNDSILDAPPAQLPHGGSSVGESMTLMRESLSTRVIHYLNREKEGPMCKVMVKNGDDLRQDQLIMQMFILMDRLLKKVNLDLKLTPYRILATGSNDGLMEFVQDSYPVSYIVANFESPQVLSFLKSHQPDPNGPYGVSAEALNTYVKSVAGYCVLTYILGIGDRHLDNLMMKTQGHLFHIDFGFIFGADPKPYPPPFKLTKEMVEGMGGPESEHYVMFKRYCCQAYNWLRKSADLILNLLSLMADGGIEELSNDPETTLQKVQEKFRLDLTDEQAEHFFLGLISDSVTALFPVLVEYIHKLATRLK